jgi:hypothetical protein
MADTLWQNTKLTFNTIYPLIDSVVSHIPNGIIFGTGILGLITLNISILVLFLFFIETVGINAVLAKSFAHLFPSIVGTSAFPSLPLFFLTSALTYLNASVISFSDVFARLGGEYSAKVQVSAAVSIICLTLMLTYTVYNGTETFTKALLNILLALTTGSLLFILHSTIFGKEAVNTLGVPILVSKVGAAKPIYACGPIVS